MIKYNIKELIAKKRFEEKRLITITDVADEIGVTRTTLSKIANSHGSYSTKTEYIEKLCHYFECPVEDVMTILPDEETDD